MTRPVASAEQALTQAHGALTEDQRDRLTPTQVLDELKRATSGFDQERWCLATIVPSSARAQPLNFPPV